MIVIITEKPSVARDIATFLGATSRRDGYLEGNGYQVTWAFGHLVSLKEPEDYDPHLKKWSLSTLPFIPQHFELKVIDDKGAKKQLQVIKNLLKSAKEIICATDAGREGELIFRYILRITNSDKKSWKRLWISSLTDEALKSAFDQMKSGTSYDPLYAAARCRNEADWIVGLNATRNLTVRYGRGKILWSVGRVQTPVLALIVKRDDEIRFFQPENFWELFTKYRDVVFKAKLDRFKTKQEAEQLLETILGKDLTIDKVSKKTEKEQPPLLFDLTELQREMNRRFSMTAAETLQAAQQLYEQKLITYPRTDSRYLTKDLISQVTETLAKLKKIKGQEIAPLDLSQLSFSNRIVNDKKVTDHHAIIPTGNLPSNLPTHMQHCYEAVVTRLIAAFYPVCTKEQTIIDAQVETVPFQAKGIRVINPGWTLLYPKKTDNEEQELPLFKAGEHGPHSPYIVEGKTKPPAHFNENALLGAMETAGKLVEDEALKEALKEKGIGTPATRASIIETLVKRNYIERKGKSLLATDLGRYLIALIQDDHLKSPELTGEWESRLKQVEKGALSALTFMEQIAEFTRRFIQNSDLTQIDFNSFGECPKCRSPMIKGKKGYGCSKWREGCQYVFWPQYQNFPLSEFHTRALLQKKILFEPIQDHILTLSSSGMIVPIPLPKPPENRKPVAKRSKK